MAFVEVIGQQPLIEVTPSEPAEVIITPGSSIRMNVVVDSNAPTNISITASQGIQGVNGAPGPTGPQGPAGPNQVTTSTTTNITGILAGNGTTVQEAQMNTNKLLGRTTAGVGDIEEISIGDGLTLSGGILSAGAGGLKSGTATAAVTDVYTTTITGVTGYATNDAYVIKFNTANSDGATININGLGAKQLVKNNNVIITGGDIQVGQEFIIIYDGTNFQMLGIAPNQMFAYVTNADSVTINKGQVVYAFGASGDRMSVKLANNTGDATSAKTIGLVFSTSIAANGTGFIITQGVIQNLNLGAYNAGDTLYLGATPGSFTATKPYAPNHLVYVGIVERANAGNGQIYVRCVNGYEMDELHDVQSQGAVNKDVLYRDTTVSPNLWKPASISTILGYTPPSTYNQNTTPTGSGTSSIPTGSLWFHSDTGIQYTYFYDGNTYQWTQETLPLGPQGPQGANGTNTINGSTATTFNGLLKGNGATISATTVTAEIGFTPENVANKENVTLDTSSTKYPTNNLVKTNLDNFADDVDYAIMTNQRLLFNF
jgi:hypothetical protein